MGIQRMTSAKSLFQLLSVQQSYPSSRLLPSFSTTMRFLSKLMIMGSKLSKLGGDRRNQLLANWKDGVESTWQFHIKQPRLVKRKRHIEEKLQEEQTKRRKLECEVRKLTNTKEQQSKVISRLKAEHLPNSRAGWSLPGVAGC